jgi:hypothetical protein
MKKSLFLIFLLLICALAARGEYLVSSPIDSYRYSCGDPSAFAVRYYVTGLPITVSNPIAAQSDGSLELDVSSVPVGGPYHIQYWVSFSCGGYQSGGIGNFTLWHHADGTWEGTNASNYGFVMPGQGGTGAAKPVSGATGRIVMAAPYLFVFPSFINVSSSVGTNPSNVTTRLEYWLPTDKGWTLTSDSSWLTVTPTSGSGGATLTCAINVAGMTAGIYTGTVTITSTAASNSPVVFHIYLTLS